MTCQVISPRLPSRESSRPVYRLLTGVVMMVGLLLTGCGGGWQTTVVRPDGAETIIGRATWRDLEEFAGEDSDDAKDDSLLLERVLSFADS